MRSLQAYHLTTCTLPTGQYLSLSVFNISCMCLVLKCSHSCLNTQTTSSIHSNMLYNIYTPSLHYYHCLDMPKQLHQYNLTAALTTCTVLILCNHSKPASDHMHTHSKFMVQAQSKLSPSSLLYPTHACNQMPQTL